MSANPGPASYHVAIVNDTALSGVRAIYVGVAGDISVIAGGNTIVYKNAAAGSVIPIAATMVTSANTTATNLIGLQS